MTGRYTKPIVQNAFKRLCHMLGKPIAPSYAEAKEGDWTLECQSRQYIVSEFYVHPDGGRGFGIHPLGYSYLTGREFYEMVDAVAKALNVLEQSGHIAFNHDGPVKPDNTVKA